MNALHSPLASRKAAQNRYSASLSPQDPYAVAWAAGFLDGEGCIHIAKQTYPAETGRNPVYRLRICITQNNLEALEVFRERVGVHANLYRVARTLGQNRQNYQLVYDGRYALALLNSVAPHLVRKRAEAMVAMAYWAEGQVGKRFGSKGLPAEVTEIRERSYRKLQKLK